MTDTRKTILVVEDSPVQALALLRLLEMQGVKIICAANGEAGIEMAHQTTPDAILLDVQMPGIDGIETCRRLRDDSSTSHIPIILLTAHTTSEIVRDGFLGGAIDFIPKDAFYEKVLIETLIQLNLINSKQRIEAKPFTPKPTENAEFSSAQLEAQPPTEQTE